MGIEYTLRIDQAERSSIHTALSRLNGAVHPVTDGDEIEFRSASSKADSMPDAVAQVEADSVYFRDNGGHGRDFLGAVVASLCSFGPVRIEEL